MIESVNYREAIPMYMYMTVQSTCMLKVICQMRLWVAGSTAFVSFCGRYRSASRDSSLYNSNDMWICHKKSRKFACWLSGSSLWGVPDRINLLSLSHQLLSTSGVKTFYGQNSKRKNPACITKTGTKCWKGKFCRLNCYDVWLAINLTLALSSVWNLCNENSKWYWIYLLITLYLKSLLICLWVRQYF